MYFEKEDVLDNRQCVILKNDWLNRENMEGKGSPLRTSDFAQCKNKSVQP